MALTNQQWTDWLKSDAAYRVVLVEVGVNSGGAESTRYLSTKGYVTGATDVPASTTYLPIISGGINLREELDIDGNPSLSFGDIEFDNTDGRYDSWLLDAWHNRSAIVRFGDARWPIADFRVIFDGVVDNLDSRDRFTLNLLLKDKMERLNGPITESTLGGNDADIADDLVPLAFGECFNISPKLVDAASHTYQFHNTTAERVIEVRDNGMKVNFTATSTELAAGKFKLNQSPVGTITASVQGDAVGSYRNTPAGLIQQIATRYGPADTRLSASEVDTTSFTEVDTFGTPGFVYVGKYLTDRENVLDVMTELAMAIQACVFMDRTGKLKIVQIKLPAAGVAKAITEADMVKNSFEIAKCWDVIGTTIIGYGKNWTVQQEVAGGVVNKHKEWYRTEWQKAKYRHDATKALHRLHECPGTTETLIVTRAHALSEATRRGDFWRTRRFTLRFEGFAQALDYSLGDRVTITHSRYGLSAGREGIITALEPDWIGSRCFVEVLV